MEKSEKDLKSMSLRQLGELSVELGGKKFHGKYIFNFVQGRDVENVDDISPLSKALREKLKGEGYFISRLRIVEKFVDPDGTVKYLFECGDGERVESVLLFDDERRTLCISTQVGCRMGCEFCATAKLGFKRNLTAGEIVDQVNRVFEDGGKVNNVVYMGMGEPLDNYEQVMRSVGILNNENGRNMGIRHLTISSCGVAERIEALAEEELKPRLAISLNSVDNEVRGRIMPINRKYDLKRLFDSVRVYQLKTGRRITFEYIMIRGLNDSDGDARGVVKQLKGVKSHVNLIEYNEHSGSDFAASSGERIRSFAAILREKGIETTIRMKQGRSIKAACGQLGADWLKKKS